MTKEKVKKEEVIESSLNIEDTNNFEKETNSEKDKVSEEKPSKKKKSKKDKKQAEIDDLKNKLNDISDKHLRLQAEFDNFRRRTMMEKVELMKSGGETILVNLLPVIDDFERALDSLKDVDDNDAGKQGTTLIYNKFEEFLKQNNVKEIDALHTDFDVDLHEALTKIPAYKKKLKGKVVDVIQKGYLLNDKVIRYSKVVIGE